MTTHIPDSWAVSRDATPDYAPQYTVYAEADGQRVATVFGEKAIAHSIAASPDLLAALEALMEFADNGTPIHPGALVLEDARAAIRKATGEQE